LAQHIRRFRVFTLISLRSPALIYVQVGW